MILSSQLTITLNNWSVHDIKGIENSAKRLTKLSNNVGLASGKFKESCHRIINAAKNDDLLGVPGEIIRPIDVRAFTYLLLNYDDFVKLVHIDTNLLDALVSPRDKLSKLTLLQLIRSYFMRYDQLKVEGGIGVLSVFIKKQLSLHENLRGVLKQVSNAKSILFSDDSAVRLVDETIESGIKLNAKFRQYGIDDYKDGDFAKKCKYIYYLQTLKNIPVGDAHPLLKEIVKPDVYDHVYNQDGGLLGHEILKILIDRTSGTITNSWREVIMAIAGDPRVSQTHPKFRKWWAFLGTARVTKVRGWLSRFDLNLFLSVLEQSARDQGNADMERMFKSRKIFMEGLLKNKCIEESRLYLSYDAESYLKGEYKKEQLPEYARVTNGEISMIYLKLKNMHMIEGSHSFKAKMLLEIPDDYSIGKYDHKWIDIDDFRGSPSPLYQSYCDEYVDDRGVIEVVHHVGGNWQHKLIKFMWDNNLMVKEEDLLSADAYREYRQKYGLMVS